MNAKGVVVKRLWGGVRARNDARFLNAFGLDVPPCQIILQHPDESLFWIVDLLRAMMRGRSAESARFVGVGSKRGLTRKSDRDAP